MRLARNVIIIISTEFCTGGYSRITWSGLLSECMMVEGVEGEVEEVLLL